MKKVLQAALFPQGNVKIEVPSKFENLYETSHGKNIVLDVNKAALALGMDPININGQVYIPIKNTAEYAKVSDRPLSGEAIEGGDVYITQTKSISPQNLGIVPTYKIFVESEDKKPSFETKVTVWGYKDGSIFIETEKDWNIDPTSNMTSKSNLKENLPLIMTIAKASGMVLENSTVTNFENRADHMKYRNDRRDAATSRLSTNRSTRTLNDTEDPFTS